MAKTVFDGSTSTLMAMKQPKAKAKARASQKQKGVVHNNDNPGAMGKEEYLQRTTLTCSLKGPKDERSSNAPSMIVLDVVLSVTTLQTHAPTAVLPFAEVQVVVLGAQKALSQSLLMQKRKEAQPMFIKSY